jgi:ubiquinone/menaquinone biosynthesis C-methylase UbiE
MDYDATEIAANYDRGRNHGPEVMDQWMNTISRYVEAANVRSILDLGCGTGRFSETLAEHFNARVIGVDPSSKMLEQARNKQVDKRVRYEPGSGEAIPLPDQSVDLVFISMVFHHFENPYQSASECRRVLREGGTVFLRAGTREQIPSYAYVDFFPPVRQLLEECLTPGTAIQEVFETAGFRIVGREAITQTIAPNLAGYVEKLAAGADSVLVRLSQSDFEAGMEVLRAEAARAGDQPVSEPIDVFVFR